MKHQPLPSYSSNDDVQTPPELCELILNHIPIPQNDTVMEPCVGDGNFKRALLDRFGCVYHSEIKEGTDFFDVKGPYDWIVTNPPWSQYKAFMEKAFQTAGNVVFLATLNHSLGLKSRWNLCDKYGFGIRKVLLLDTPPKPWPQSGFQLGAVWWSRAYSNMPTFVDLRG